MPSKNPDLGNKRPGFTSQLCPDSVWLHILISFLVPTSDHGHRIKWHVIIKTRTKPGKNVGIRQTSTKYDIKWILSFNLSFILGLRKFHLSDSWTASPVSPPWSSPKTPLQCLPQVMSQEWTWNQSASLTAIHLPLTNLTHCSHTFKEQISIMHPRHKSTLALSC